MDDKFQKYCFSLSSCEEITDENTAIAALFLCESAHFNKFYATALKLKNKEIYEHDLLQEDKLFQDEYKLFLQQLYKHPNYDKFVWCEIFKIVEKIRGFCKWDDDFRDYVQELHDEGIIFSSETYSLLDHLGINLIYSQDGWAFTFYSDWLKRKPLWTLEEAAMLYMGKST